VIAFEVELRMDSADISQIHGEGETRFPPDPEGNRVQRNTAHRGVFLREPFHIPDLACFG
jgi:hypothetical protein